MKQFRQIIQNFAYSGELTNTTVIEWETEKRQGDARNATEEDMAQVGDAAAAGYLAQIEALKTAHAAEIKTIQDQLAAASSPPASPPVLSQLATVFGGLDPAIQRAFAAAFAVVRTLIQADQVGLARGYIEDLAVPEDLAETKAGILTLLA
jgi:hypothetical protein